MNDTSSALVLFSGGQDSTTCLAWALERFERVETVAFDYRQRHRIELDQRLVVLEEIRRRLPKWSNRLGEDHFVDMGVLGQISDTSLTRDMEFEIEKGGLPNSFVPGRNLLFFTFAAAIGLAARHPPPGGRHVRDGLLGLSRLPRQHAEIPAGDAQSRHGPRLRAAYAADVARQGRDLVAGRGTGWCCAD